MANFKNINVEQIDNFRNLFKSFDDVLSQDVVMVFAYPYVDVPSGMTLSSVCKTELISFALAISNADNQISQEETDLLNALFDLQGDAASYKSLADTIPANFLSTVPNWVRAYASMPSLVLSTAEKEKMVSGTIEHLGQLISLVDGVEAVELSMTKSYSDMCTNYINNH